MEIFWDFKQDLSFLQFTTNRAREFRTGKHAWYNPTPSILYFYTLYKTYWDRRTTITSTFLCKISLKLVFNLTLFSTEQYVYNTFLSYLPLQANRNFLFTRKGYKSSILWISEKYEKKIRYQPKSVILCFKHRL